MRKELDVTTLTAEAIGAASAEVTTRPISLTYRGKVGCACGCNGTYRDTLSAITRARNDILTLVADTSGEARIGGRPVKVTRLMVSPGSWVSVEYGNGRVVTVYTDGRAL